MVIITHWLNIETFGAIGVTIFFVLSGFLITKILIDKRGNPKFTGLKNFYARRCLRIFPIYYLTIFLLIIFQSWTEVLIRPNYLYFITYTENFLLVKNGQWYGNISHLWSLAVEEQFYLIWPWIILFVNKKYLLHVIISFILIGIISFYFVRGMRLGVLLTFTCFDAFGLGALLSWQITYKAEYSKKFFFYLSIAAFISCLLLGYNIHTHNLLYPLRTESAIIALWAITYIVHHREKVRLKFILNNKTLIFLGKISYGLYLYHYLIIIPPITRLLNKLNFYVPYYQYNTRCQVYLILFEDAVLLILLSWLSYTVIEKPFLKLKRYFNSENQKSALEKAYLLRI